MRAALFLALAATNEAPEEALRAFEFSNPPVATIDVGTLYSGREELLDPRVVLPTWHRHARNEAAMVFEATRSCPPHALPSPVSDVALAKAYAWHERTCAGGPPPDDLLAKPPFVHPSGKSYAAMAHRTSDRHVLEIDSGELAHLGSREWLGLSRGDRVVQTADRIVFADRGPLGITKLRFHDRAAWNGDFVLVPRSPSCTRPASTLLCWEPVARNDGWQRALVAIGLVALVAMVIAFVRERRRAARDRLHLIRTLTHELRTPAMALGLDIEPLRASYDEIPAHLQEPLLRLSGGIARLHRVIHHSARALELLEGKGELAEPVAIESARALLEDFDVVWEGDDGPITTDPEWLSIAIRNLVENAHKHGKPPVIVRARFDGDLVIRVEDAGDFTPGKKSDGLGLGLMLVERIARTLGGTLARETKPTAFVLRIPRKP